MSALDALVAAMNPNLLDAIADLIGGQQFSEAQKRLREMAEAQRTALAKVKP